MKIMITQKDLDDIETRLRDVFVTKEDFTDFKSKLFDKLDKIVKNTDNTNVEVELVEKRVSKIESHLNLSSE